jgi:hypothetical protein
MVVVSIPPEYRCNPFDMSPSGDLFYADKRNVEHVKKAIEEGNNQIKAGKSTSVNGLEELDAFLNSL